MIRRRHICILNLLFAVIFATTTTIDAQAEKKIIDNLPAKSEIVSNFNTQKLKDHLAGLNLHHIEGIWQFTATGVEIAICRREDPARGNMQQVSSYNIILLFSPNRALRAGIIMGIATPTPNRGEYDARIYTQAVGSTLVIPKHFTLTLDDDDSALTFRQHRSALSFNPWRLLPYLWRGAIQKVPKTKSSTGCVRIYPEPILPREPIYL